MLWLSKSHAGSRQVHEHYRTWQSFCASVAGAGGAHGLGLEALPGMWQHADDQERQLHAAAVVFHGSPAGAGAAPSVPRLRTRRTRSSRRCWCGAVGMPGRCIAVPWTTGSTGACRCGGRRSCCVRGWGARSAGGCGARWIAPPRRALLSGRQHGASLAGWGGPGGPGQRGRAVAGHCADASGGHGWPVGQAQGAQRVVLLLADSVSGLLYAAGGRRGRESGGPGSTCLSGPSRRGWTGSAAGRDSDGARGCWPTAPQAGLGQHQRCVWHMWRNLGGELTTSRQPPRPADRRGGRAVRQQARAELGALIHQVIDAQSYEQAEAALHAARASPGRSPRPAAQRAVGSRAGAPAGLLPGCSA